MALQHLTLTEAQRRLDVLVNQSRQASRSILITTDDGESLAWLAPTPDPSEFKRNRQNAVLNAHLSLLDEVLQMLADGMAIPDTLTLLRDQLDALYRAAVESRPLFRQIVLLSRLAVESVSDGSLQPDQVSALRFGMELLRKPVVTEEDLRQYNRRLMDSCLQPDISFDETLLSQYVDET